MSVEELNNKCIGIDMGLTNLITLSNRKIVEPPKYLRGSEKKLAKEQARQDKAQAKMAKEALAEFKKETLEKEKEEKVEKKEEKKESKRQTTLQAHATKADIEEAKARRRLASKEGRASIFSFGKPKKRKQGKSLSRKKMQLF